MLVDSLHEMLAFVDGEGQGLFAIHIFARLRGGKVNERMPMVGSACKNDVNVITFHQLSKIVVFGRSLSLLGELLRRFLPMLFVHVTQRDDLTKMTGVFGVASAHSATANQSDTGTVVRGEGFLGRGGREQLAFDKPHRQTSCRGGS